MKMVFLGLYERKKMRLIEKEPKRYYDWMLWKMRQVDNEESMSKKIGLDIDKKLAETNKVKVEN